MISILGGGVIVIDKMPGCACTCGCFCGGEVVAIRRVSQMVELQEILIAPTAKCNYKGKATGKRWPPWHHSNLCQGGLVIIQF